MNRFTLLARAALLRLLLCTALLQSAPSQRLSADPVASSHGGLPHISYTADPHNTRALIFMNNPEFLWASNGVCDLADESHPTSNRSCQTSLFRIDELKRGNYRGWWEHRNMMPFAVRSGLIFSNPSSKTAVVEVLGAAIEVNSFRRGGNEFVELLNSQKMPQRISIAPGERVLLNQVSNRWIHPSHFFAGVVDFNIVEGSIALDEVVFRREPAHKLNALGYSQRNVWGVHESLVYKGISAISAVVLRGAEFQLTDATPSGSLPLSYKHSDTLSSERPNGHCAPELAPTCSGQALSKQLEPIPQNSWVSHIAPDPRDANPKRKRAIVDDLIELVIPASTPQCPSTWPMPLAVSENSCMRMSAQFHWFLENFNHWRLPNWGNWAVQYKHPVRVTNTSNRSRTVALKLTADGASAIAYRGTGVTELWKQTFLDPRTKDAKRASIVLAQSNIEPGSTVELEAEFILSGPGAGTLEHHIEIIE